jgi:adenylate cyclase
MLCAICLGIGLLGIVGSMLPVLSNAEERLGLHLLYQLRGVEKPRSDVMIVAIDRKSAKALNLPLSPHKWPRSLHARLLEVLSEYHPAVIAFDLIFSDSRSPSGDQALADAIRRSGNVILTQPIDRETLALLDDNGRLISRMVVQKRVTALPLIADAAVAQAPFPLPKVPIKLNQYWRFGPGLEESPTLPVVVMHVYAKEAFHDFIALLKRVAPEASATFPPLNPETGKARDVIDAIQPTYRLFKKDGSLANRLMAALQKGCKGRPLSPRERQARAFIALYGAGGSGYLNFYGPPGTIETLSYHDLLATHASLLAGDPLLPSLRGKAIFVGLTEDDWLRANDGFYTAFTGKNGTDISGVELAATAFSNLLERKEVHPMGPVAQLAFLLAWGGLCTLMAARCASLPAAGGLLLLCGLYLALALIRFKSYGSWYPLVVPMLVQMPCAFIAGLGWKYRLANLERRNIREAFGYYLPDEVVNRLAVNVKALRGGGKVLYGICLFTDAESYTPLSERLDPEQLTQLMNDYYEAIFRPIKEHKGLVLQVVGDSVLAIWSAPHPDDRLKKAARNAAIAIHQAVQEFNSRAAYPLPTRIGIHAGEILLGNIGAMDHFEYRPVGDIVNTASRLEGLNKFLGTRVLASREALGNGNGCLFRPMGKFVFKGKSQPVEVYEITRERTLPPESRIQTHQWFASGLEAFGNRRWEDANRLFEKILEMDAGDGPSAFYRKRCEELRRRPPNGDWDGAVHLKSK